MKAKISVRSSDLHCFLQHHVQNVPPLVKELINHTGVRIIKCWKKVEHL